MNNAITKATEYPKARKRIDRFAHSDMLSLTSEKVRYDLAESVSQDLTLADVISESDYRELEAAPLGYSSAAGNPELREIIARRHTGVNADDVVITQGGMHALFLMGQILAGDGNELLIHQPSFPLTVLTMQMKTLTVNTFTSDFQDRYRVNAEEVLKKLNPSTRLVCLESPRNPSGVCVEVSTVKTLLMEMMQRCPDAYLLVDETYREASYANSPPKESMINCDTGSINSRLIVTGSLSKSHGAPGLRLGWAITKDKWLREQLVRGKFQTIIANGTLDEFLAIQVLKKAETVLSTRRQQLGLAKTLVADWVRENATLIEWVEPDAGALCCIALSKDRFDNAALSQFYESLQHRSVRVAPGNWFGESARIFRLGFGFLTLQDTKTALKEISCALTDAAI
jgi:aspartate/methionine/tyrosine aminotransferase